MKRQNLLIPWNSYLLAIRSQNELLMKTTKFVDPLKFIFACYTQPEWTFDEKNKIYWPSDIHICMLYAARMNFWWKKVVIRTPPKIRICMLYAARMTFLVIFSRGYAWVAYSSKSVTLFLHKTPNFGGAILLCIEAKSALAKILCRGTPGSRIVANPSPKFVTSQKKSFLDP